MRWTGVAILVAGAWFVGLLCGMALELGRGDGRCQDAGTWIAPGPDAAPLDYPGGIL